MLTQMEWEQLNQIISRLYMQDNTTKLRTAFLEELKKMVPFSFSDFCMSVLRPGNSYALTDPIIISNYDKKFEQKFMDRYDEKFHSLDYFSWLFNSKESFVIRESDHISEEIRKRSTFYQEYLEPFDLIHIASLVVCLNGRCVCALTLYNSANRGDFTDKDIYILQRLLPHLQSQMEKILRKEKSAAPDPSLYLKQQFSLTNRESQIAKLIYKGYSNREIAEELVIAEETVKKHVYNIFQKLGLTHRAQMASFVVKNNLTDIFLS